MKLTLALFVAVVCVAPTMFASSLTWNFLNDVPTSSTGVAVNSPHSFTDTQGDTTTITASILKSSANSTQLFEKKQGGDEFGLGIFDTNNNEIDTNSIVKLDLNNLLSLNPSFISITLESVQTGEGGSVHYGNTGNGFNVSDENSHNLDLTTLRADGGYIEIQATSNDVLVGNISASAITTQAPTPEPASYGLLGIGLLATAVTVVQRRLRLQGAQRPH